MLAKKNLTLIIILVILGLTAYLYAGPYQAWRRQKQTADQKNWLSAVDVSQLDKVEAIDAQGNSHIIQKQSDAWLVSPDNWPAEQTISGALMEKLTDLVKAELEVASINKENQQKFGLGGGSIKVKLYISGQAVGDFIIGNIASDYNSTYIGRENDERTYRAPTTFVRAFDFDSWKDRTILNITAANVQEVIWQYPVYALAINNYPEKSGEVYWHASSTRERLNKDKVGAFLNSIAKLEASDIPDQIAADTGLEKPELTLKFSGNGIDETLLLGGRNDQGSEYYLRKKSTGQIFLITAADKKNLAKNISELK